MNQDSPRLRRAIRDYRVARHELIESLQSEAPGATVVSRGQAFSVIIGRGGSPSLHTSRVVSVQRPNPAQEPTPIQESQS